MPAPRGAGVLNEVDKRLSIIEWNGIVDQPMENFKSEWKSFKVDLMQSMRDALRDNNDLLLQEIRASEHRLRTEFKHDIEASKYEIIEEITEFIDYRLLPQIDNLDKRVTKLETKTA